jgi:O-antigen/teichoic acid export membrane protein
LIPVYGLVGAAWASVCSFWFLFFLGAFFIQKDVGGWEVIMSVTLRTVVTLVASWYVWRYVGDKMHVSLALCVGGCFAGAIAYILRLFTLQDLYFVLRLHKRTVGNDATHAES